MRQGGGAKQESYRNGVWDSREQVVESVDFTTPAQALWGPVRPIAPRRRDMLRSYVTVVCRAKHLWRQCRRVGGRWISGTTKVFIESVGLPRVRCGTHGADGAGGAVGSGTVRAYPDTSDLAACWSRSRTSRAAVRKSLRSAWARSGRSCTPRQRRCRRHRLSSRRFASDRDRRISYKRGHRYLMWSSIITAAGWVGRPGPHDTALHVVLSTSSYPQLSALLTPAFLPILPD